MIDADVAVVGGGLAGSTAALAAARHRPDASVYLLSTDGPDFGDGLLRVLRAAPSGEHPVVDPVAAAADLPEDHPYRLLGTDALREGLALFDDVTRETYCGASSSANALVPTFHGRVTPAARYPAAMAPGLASRAASALLVGLAELPDLDGPLAASRLRTAGIPFDVAGTNVSLPVEVNDGQPAVALARELDANPTVAEGRDLRGVLADRVRPSLGVADRVGFPAVLGRTETAAVHAALGAALDVDVFEVPLPGPHLPGRRLQDCFASALEAADVRSLGHGIDVGGSGVDAAVPADGPVRVTLADGETVRASAVVLATGGLAAGGLRTDRTGVCEPLFDCRVPHPSGRLAWSDPDPFGDHAFARFGVRIDDAARPLDGDGRPHDGRLFAAGRVVGGRNFVAEGSQGGVSLATAHVAGTRAVEVA